MREVKAACCPCFKLCVSVSVYTESNVKTVVKFLANKADSDRCSQGVPP